VENLNKQKFNDEYTIKRVSVINEEILLIFFSILLFFQLDNYINLSVSGDPSIVGNSIDYVIIFLTLVCLYFPKKITLTQKSIFITTALVFRLKALMQFPVLSSDLHRNLLFGSILADGWNPYLWTIENLSILFQQGFISKVSFTSEWASHSFDYPSLAILFFAFITFLVPVDNFYAFVFAKLVLMLIDILNAYLIYRILTIHFNLGEVSKKVALLYLINPISVFWVNIEGQFEILPLFFILISFYFLFYIPVPNTEIPSQPLKKWIKIEYLPHLIGFFLGCGVLLKYFPIIYIIPVTFYFGKNIKYIVNFFSFFILTIVFFSIPFLLNSFYVTNFLLFQIIRNSNSVSDTNFDIGLGIEIPVFLILIILIGLIFILTIRKKQDKKLQTSILGLFSMYLFIFINNSIFSWYVLWMYGTLLFINTKYDEFYRSLLWVISLILLILIWKPDYIILIIQILIITYFLTLEKIRRKLFFNQKFR
jgi:hypothetical protein